MKESFIFYASFYQAINELSDDSEKLAVYTAIAEYALTGKIPDLCGATMGFFVLIKPQLDANNQRYENGCKGGRPRKKREETEKVKEKKTSLPEENNAPAQEETQDVTFDYDGDRKLHGIDDNLFSYWQRNFPNRDVAQELRNAEIWLDSHRNQRKKDIKQFLTSWMIRAQERPVPVGSYDKFDRHYQVYTPEKEPEGRHFDGF